MKRKNKGGRPSTQPSAEETVQYFIQLCKKVQRIPEKGEFLTEYNGKGSKNWINVIHKHFGKWKTLISTAAEKDKYISQLLVVQGGADKFGRKSYLQKGYKFCREHHRYPTESDIWSSLGLDLKAIQATFGTFEKFKQEIRSEYKKELRHFVDRTIWSPQRIRTTRDKLSKARVIFCTSAVAGSQVHEGFHRAIESFCQHNHGELVIFPVNGELNDLDSRFIDSEMHVIFGDVRITDEFMLSSIKIRANQIDPSTSIYRSLPQGVSAVYGATKQRMTVRPAPKTILDPPYALGTGCITLPHYVRKPTKDKMGKVVHEFDNFDDRLNYIAAKNHMLGGVIVEIDKDGTVFTRVVQAYEDGSFADRNTLYCPNKIEEGRPPAAIIFGDIHTAQTNMEVLKAFIFEADRLKIKTAVLHDIFDGFTINHHRQDNMIRKAQILSHEAIPNLKAELENLAEFLELILEQFENVIVVKSNHDLWLDEYLDLLLFGKDPQNLRIGLQLALVKLDEHKPLEHFVKQHLIGKKVKPELINRLRFLDEGEDYMISGVNVGHHGHRAANGAKGSMRGLEQALPVAFTANIHTPEIFGRHHRVGCLGKRDMDYTTGSPATSWMYTSGYLHVDGGQQLVTYVNGKLNPSWRRG